MVRWIACLCVMAAGFLWAKGADAHPAGQPPVTTTVPPSPSGLVTIVKAGPAPATVEPVVGDTYSAYRGHVDFRLYLERPSGWHENLLFALRYNGCPVGATGALRMTVYHARVLQNGGFTGTVVATRKRYSRPLTLWKRSDGGLYRVPVLSQTYYVLRVASSPACHWEFAGEPAD